jgi:hypothetical protein
MDASGTTFAAPTGSPVRTSQTLPGSVESAEAGHLRRLLEIQPECLLRIGRDGLLLACNEAGLRLLGKDNLAQVLDRPFDEHLRMDDLPGWCAFIEQVWSDGAGSFEGDLAPTADGGRRTAQFKAVALADHPDGIDSLLLTVRDIVMLRLIGPALEQQQAAAELRARVAALEDDVRRLESERDSANLACAEADAARAEADAARTEADAARTRAEHALQQGSERVRQAEEAVERQRAEHEAFAAERAEAAAEQQRLADIVQQLGAELRRLSAEHETGHAAIARELQETRADAAARHEQYREALAEAEARYTQALAEFTAAQDRDEPFATGRLAQQLSRELQTVVATLDERLHLLRSSPRVDASCRPMIEAVQSDALRVAALVRQLCPVRPESAARPDAG